MTFDFAKAYANFLLSLGVMGKGMFAIFAVMLVLYLCIRALTRAFPSDTPDR